MAEENNIGASRLIGTNNIQSAADSVTTQFNKVAQAASNLSSAFNKSGGAAGRSGGSGSSVWNSGSNRNNYSSNGGGGSFSGASFGGARGGNGGGGNFSGGSLSRGNKIATTIGAGAGVVSAITQYGNRNMAGMMQQNFFGTQAALAGGGPAGAGVNVAARLAFANNYAALNTNDAAAAAYTNQYTFGNSVFNGAANPAFIAGQRQANSFGYVSPTMGAAAAANAAQQTYTARSNYMAQAYGLGPTIGPGGVQTPMSQIAQNIYNRTFGNNKVTVQGFNAASRQNGTLNTNLQYYAQQMGWSQSTVQEYQNYLQGQVTAQSHGMSASNYASLTQKAGAGDASAQSALKKIGIGTSAFEAQRNLNSTKATRQEDINESMASAFTKTTNVVNQFSKALTALMQNTGLDKLLGTSAGIASPISNALGGFSGAFGAASGIYGASRLFGGGGGPIVGAAGNLFRGGGGSMGSRGANGVYNITTARAGVGMTAAGASEGAMTAAGPVGLTLLAASLVGNTTQNTMNKIGYKQAQKNGLDQFNNSKISMPSNWTVANYADYEQQYVNKAMGLKPAERAAWIKNFIATHQGTGGTSAPAGYGQASSSSGGSGNPVSNGKVTGGGANDAAVIRAAETQLNVPYVWGGETPGKAMDCSGLTQWAYRQVGVKIPRVAADQQKTGKQVPTNATQPGDLLFVGSPAHHVVMSIGGGKVIEAPHTGERVRIRSFSPSEFTSASRIVGSVGNMSSITGSQGSTPTLNQSQSLSGGDIGMLGGTSEAAVVAAGLSGMSGGLPMTSSSRSASGTSGTSNLGATPKANGNNSKSGLQSYAKALLAKYGWAGQWASFNALEMSEAGWDIHATNPTSGAYGLPQALPASKMASAGSDWKTSGDTQLAWMMSYIKGRYGSPDQAWSFHKKNNWYDSGAWNIDKDQGATVHKGEMIIPAQQAETIRQTLLNNSFNPNVSKNSSGGITFGDINVTMPAGYTGSAQDAQDIGKVIASTITEQLRVKTLQIGQ